MNKYTFFKFLYDKKFGLFLFILAQIIVTSVLYLDSNLTVHLDNLVYIFLINFILYTVYLLFEYKKIYYYNKQILESLNLKNHAFDLPLEVFYDNHQYFMNYYVNELFKYHNENDKNTRIKFKENLEFIESWVHEIKVPLSAMKLLLDNSLTKSKEEMMYSLEDEVYKIDNYVQQVLYYSRLGDFSKDYLLKDVNLNNLVKKLVKKNAKYFIEKKLSIDLRDLSFEVLTDDKWLSYIVNQIIINAIKYSKNNSKIEIYASRSENLTKLTIVDYGIGIPKEDLSRVFDKGFTGKNGRISSNSKSTGIGLYLAKNLAKKLGHDIEISSMQNKNTKVSIIFRKLNNLQDLF